MEIFKKINFKHFFTLIELIVVIVVLGVLAAIVIPNISSFKEEAQETAIKADARNIQTAVDMFMLDYHGATPTKDKATLGNPQIVELYGLKPDYLRDLPKEGSAKFWLDENNTVWASKVDSPTNVSYDNENQILSWDTVDGATLYKIYKLNSETNANASSAHVSYLKDIPVTKGDKQETQLIPLEKGFYLVTALDLFDSESAPTGENTKYVGYGEGPDKKYIKEETNVSKTPVTSLVFTNAGATGYLGPNQNQLNTTYLETPLENKVTSQNGIQLWTVPESGTYKIEASGAQGGGEGDYLGGKGAKMIGDFELTKGQVLKILIGHKGGSYNMYPYSSYGGGGGTFVATTNNTPLLVAGGGGGATGGWSWGQTLNEFVASGRDGLASPIADSQGNASYKGAGFNENGTEDSKSFINGGQGSSSINTTTGGTHGGFGGSGKMHGNGGGGSGGGGYVGGLGGLQSLGGGGGSSYNTGLNQSNTSGSNSGHGKLTITYLGQ